MKWLVRVAVVVLVVSWNEQRQTIGRLQKDIDFLLASDDAAAERLAFARWIQEWSEDHAREVAFWGPA